MGQLGHSAPDTEVCLEGARLLHRSTARHPPIILASEFSFDHTVALLLRLMGTLGAIPVPGAFHQPLATGGHKQATVTIILNAVMPRPWSSPGNGFPVRGFILEMTFVPASPGKLH